MHRQTLDAVVTALRAAGGRSAGVTAATPGTSRITARRCPEHLVETGVAGRTQRYGGAGRPEMEYRWR